MTETGTDPGAASVWTSYTAAKEEEADCRRAWAHKAKRAAEQEAKASGADV